MLLIMEQFNVQEVYLMTIVRLHVMMVTSWLEMLLEHVKITGCGVVLILFAQKVFEVL